LEQWVEEKKLIPVIDKVFQGLEQVAEAMEHLETGRCTGKVIVHVAKEDKKEDKN